eukprot:10894096-Lingulodinium_polyedra.AAC.1
MQRDYALVEIIPLGVVENPIREPETGKVGCGPPDCRPLFYAGRAEALLQATPRHPLCRSPPRP